MALVGTITTVSVGTTVPSNADGFDGGIYFQVSSGTVVKVWKKDSGAWSPVGSVAPSLVSYTPVITSTVGTIAGFANIGGRYIVIGKMCFVEAHFDITNNGTGSGRIDVTLPLPSLDASSGAFPCGVGSGRRLSDAKMLRCSASGNGGLSMTVLLYDGTYPGAVSAFDVSLAYELLV